MTTEKPERTSRIGGVRRLPSGRWQARYTRDGVTYRAPETFATEDEAWDYLVVIDASMLTGDWRRPDDAGKETLVTYGHRWIDTHPKARATTTALYRREFDRHVTPYLGHLRLREISQAVVRKWLAELRKDLSAAQAETVSRRRATRRDGSSTAARAYRLLAAIMFTAVKDGEILATPCTLDGAREAPSDDGVEERPTLSVDEVATLAHTVPDRYRALVLVLAWCGLRIGEACALRREDVDLTPGSESLRVSERVYRIDGAWDYSRPKSKAGRRRVPVPPHIAPNLIDHLATFTGPGDDALVFTTRTGATCRQVAPVAITKRLDAMGRDDVRVHDLRHTGNTLAAIAGASQAELMRRMGHASSIAAQGYLHTVEDHGRAVADLLSDIAAGANVVPLASRRRRRRTG
jgi:integrase